MKRIVCLGFLGLLTLTGAGCGGGERLNAGGSTFVAPIMSKWVSEYQKLKNVSVNYTSSGSGAGIQQMTEKVYDFGCSDAFLRKAQLKTARDTGGDVVHVPLALGAVVPAYNLAEVAKPVRFTGAVLAKIFLGDIKRWNDKELQDLQEDGVKLPDKAIAVVHRSDGSGTTFIWVDYLSKVSPAWEKKVGVNTSVKWPLGEARKGNEGVAGYIGETPGALGYTELTYALQNKLKYGSVKNKADNYVAADLKSVTAAADAELAEIPEDLRFSLTNARGKDSYPISGAVWAVLYVNQPAAKGKLIVEFLRWVTHDGQRYCDDLHYGRLPSSLVERVEKQLAKVKTAG